LKWEWWNTLPEELLIKNTAKEFYEGELIYLKSSKPWSKLAAGGRPLVIKTYKGTEWGIKVNDNSAKMWIIEVTDAEHTY
jgi:hypothetical protein